MGDKFDKTGPHSLSLGYAIVVPHMGLRLQRDTWKSTSLYIFLFGFVYFLPSSPSPPEGWSWAPTRTLEHHFQTVDLTYFFSYFVSDLFPDCLEGLWLRMVSDASKRKAAQKKAAAAAKRGGKAAAAAASSKAAALEAQKAAVKVANEVTKLQISDRTCTGVLCSHPLSRDIRVSTLHWSFLWMI